MHASDIFYLTNDNRAFLFFQMANFFAPNLFLQTFVHHLRMKLKIFFEIFRIVPRHTQQVLRIFAQFSQKNKLRKMIYTICSKIKIAQNYLRKEQSCAKCLVSYNKLAQKLNANPKIIILYL